MALTAIGGGAWSQITGTIKIVVPLPPGSAQDIFSRVLADEVSRARGLTIVIENRPGASTAVGTESVSHEAPDGKTLLVGCTDHCARLWDTGTGVAVGPILPSLSQVVAVAFCTDGKAMITQGRTHTQLWRLAELPDDPSYLSVWAATATGLEMDQQGGIHPLGIEAWSDGRRRLSELGGPPLAETN